MAVVIDATVGGAASNSFSTLAESETYMESRLNGATWTAATTDNKNRALVEATRLLSIKQWRGERASSTQALAWPRFNAPDPDNPNGWYYESDVIPQRVKDATAELAFQFIKQGTDDLAAADVNAGVVEKTVDVLTTRWESSFSRPTGLARFTLLQQLIRPLLYGTSVNQTTLVRG